MSKRIDKQSLPDELAGDERMAEVPEQLYGAGIASNYQGQGLKLSKHFKAV